MTIIDLAENKTFKQEQEIQFAMEVIAHSDPEVGKRWRTLAERALRKYRFPPRPDKATYHIEDCNFTKDQSKAIRAGMSAYLEAYRINADARHFDMLVEIWKLQRVVAELQIQIERDSNKEGK